MDLVNIFNANSIEYKLEKNYSLKKVEYYKDENLLKLYLDTFVIEDEFKYIASCFQELFSNIKIELINEDKNENENAKVYELNKKFIYSLLKKLNKTSPCVACIEEEDIDIENDKLIISFPYKKAMEDFCENQLDKKIIQLVKKFTKRDISLVTQLQKLMDNDNYLELLDEIDKKEAKKTLVNRPISKKDSNISGKIDSDSGIIKYGPKIKSEVSDISSLNLESGRVCVNGTVLSYEDRETKSGKMLLIFDLADKTSAITCKMFMNKDKYSLIDSKIKEGTALKLEGDVQYDNFSKCNIIMARSIENGIIERRNEKSKDKRVELHMYSKMSALDGFVDLKELMDLISKWGHTSVGITDAGVVQAFPDLVNEAKKKDIKPLYGIESKILNNNLRILSNKKDDTQYNNFVVFDIETTGFSKIFDRITEIGAVKVENNKIVEVYNQLVNPEKAIPEKVVELTGITNDLVKDEPTIEKVLPEFLNFVGDCTLVAHNADFDIGFIKENSIRLNYDFDSSYIDTLAFARALFPENKRHRLNDLTKLLEIPLENHHRACDDAKATAQIFIEMLNILKEKDIKLDENINSIKTDWPISKNEGFNSIIYAQNYTGLKNLYKLVSESSLHYFFKTGGMPKFLIDEHRDGILIGSGNSDGELFKAILNHEPEEKLKDIISYYDFLEIQPIHVNIPLIKDGKVESIKHLEDINKYICSLGEKYNKLVVATGDVHYLNPEDYIYRNIILKGQGKNRFLEDEARLYLRTTDEMLEDFKYLGKEKAKEVVVENTNKIADLLEDMKPIPDGTYPPVIEGSDTELREITYNKAIEIYGDPLPDIVKQRLDRELNSIIANGYAVLYIIAQKLVWRSNDDGYLVGSRGSVGSSFVATMAGITEVNPLIPHYICPECKHSEFIEDKNVGSGIDLPDKICPICRHKLNKDGHDIPFEVFLGFEGDKEPDIDLNFAGEYQPTCHKYTEELFGHDKVFRAGTIGTIAENTAFGYIKKYYEDIGKSLHPAEVKKLQQGIVGVKRTSGQHPGGVMIVPHDKDIYDFCPVQHPADDPNSDIITTHFNYKSISGRILKLDLLGHDVPTIIKMLSDITGIDPLNIPLDDEETMKIFSSGECLNPIHEFSTMDIGTLGIPEFGTNFVRQMLRDTRPTTFSELVRISGLSHGTDVWLNNAQDLIRDGIVELKDTICTRDDIMIYLISKGLDKKKSFQIMERVRKGKSLSDETLEYMRSFDVPEWYIDSCEKIKYMFPKAHAVAYVLMSYRIAYFKVHHPEAFYATFFTIKIADYPGDLICQGLEAIQERMQEIKDMGKEASPKDLSTFSVLEVAEEMCARGINSSKVDLEKSDALTFKVLEKGFIQPPFRALEGVSDAHSLAIKDVVENEEFISIEDFRKKTKINKNALESLKNHGVLDHLPDTNQISFL